MHTCTSLRIRIVKLLYIRCIFFVRRTDVWSSCVCRNKGQQSVEELDSTGLFPIQNTTTRLPPFLFGQHTLPAICINYVVMMLCRVWGSWSVPMSTVNSEVASAGGLVSFACWLVLHNKTSKFYHVALQTFRNEKA